MLFNKKEKQPRHETGTIFLLGEEDSLDNIMRILMDKFKIPYSEGGNTLNLCEGDIVLNIAVAARKHSEDEDKYVKENAGKVLGHFYKVKAEKPDVKTNLVYQLDMVNSIAIVNYAFEPDNREQKLEMIKAPLMDSLAGWGAVMLLNGSPDGIYYKDAGGNVRLILDENGKSDVDVFMPYAMNAPDMSDALPESLDRRSVSRKKLADRGIFVTNFYPLIEAKSQALCRTPEEIAKRAVALLTVALYSEAMLGEEHLSPKEAYEEYADEIIKSFGAEEFFSPKEWEYLHNENSSEQERISFSWQYENLYVMEWALGLGKEEGELDFPDSICDVSYTVRMLVNCRTIEDILNISKPKTEDELLDECDWIFCLDWACVDTRLKKLPAPAGMNGGVVMERHKSLNWLVGYNEAEWDNVTTDT